MKNQKWSVGTPPTNLVQPVDVLRSASKVEPTHRLLWASPTSYPFTKPPFPDLSVSVKHRHALHGHQGGSFQILTATGGYQPGICALRSYRSPQTYSASIKQNPGKGEFGRCTCDRHCQPASYPEGSPSSTSARCALGNHGVCSSVISDEQIGKRP